MMNKILKATKILQGLPGCITKSQQHNTYLAHIFRQIILLAFSGSLIAQPTASFFTTDTLGCAPHSVAFQQYSINAVSFYWDFGDGNTSVLANPTNLYVNPGFYTVKLTVYDINGNADSLTISHYIHVNPKPQALFNSSATEVCAGAFPVQFTDYSVDAVNWLWDFGDGDTSNVQHPSHTYTTAGQKTVTLIVENQFGCSDISVQNNAIKVHALPVVDFSVDTSIACQNNSTLQFTDQSSQGVSWVWDFGDNNQSVLHNPQHTYNTYGYFHVTLSVSDSNNCSNSLTKNGFIHILEPFDPVFTTYHTEACTPLQAYFYNQTPNTMSLLWDYGDNTTSTSSYPLHVYNAPGIYNVSLTVTDSNNCTYTTVADSAAIAHETPVADFALTNSSGCAPLYVSFTDNSIAANKWIWDFGDGDSSTAQHPLHNYHTPGYHTVTLSVFDTTTTGIWAPEGCSAAITLPDTVHVLNPGIQFTASDSDGCAPLNVSFTDQTQGAVQWFWNFGDGYTSSFQNPQHTYTTPGLYDVTCIVTNTNGCTDTLIKQGLIHILGPDFQYNPPQALDGCVPLTVHLNSNSIGYNTWYWDFGDGDTSSLPNPTHTYGSEGEYIVSLYTEAANGCALLIDTFAIYKVHQVKADFGMQIDNCPDFKVTFTDTSSGAISTWSWDFGDSTYASVENPVHYYSHAGIYSVSLKVSDQFGCQDSKSLVSGVTLMPCDYNGNCTGWGIQGPIVIKGTLKGCNPFEVHFINPIDSTVSWSWDFGDGDTSNTENPIHTYTQSGYYDVTLITEDINGNIDTIYHPHHVYVSDLTSGFNLSKQVSCQNMMVDLTDQSTNTVLWHWNFGDGDTSSLQNPSHTFSLNNSNFNITQLVKDSLGCSDMSVRNVFTGLPNPVFTYPLKICANDTAQFASNLNVFSSYLWDFGDGHSSTVPNPTHVYDSSGIFQITLTATDTGNCLHQYILPYPVEVTKPLADFTTYQVTETCFPYHVNFYNLSSDFDNLLWEFGDGDTSTTVGVQNHYYTYGSYNVSLTIYKNGCAAKTEKPAYINIHQAVADFSLSQDRTCLPVTATLNDLSDKAASWAWSFGDGDSSSLQNPVHHFQTFPADSITLNIVDSNGCQAEVTKANIDVFKFNIAAINTTGCVPLQTSFSETQNNAVSWKWDFGDNTSSVLQNPQHTYTSPGIYDVSLIAQSPDGCFDTISLDSFVIAGQVIADFSAPSNIGCAPALVTFNNLSSGSDTWLWDFGDSSISTQSNPSHIFNNPGLYTVSLIASDSLGCSDTITKVDQIEVLGPIANFSVSDTSGCNPLTVHFTDLSAGAVSWSWYFGDGDTSTVQNPSHVYASDGQYSVSLITEDTIGCNALYTYPVQLHILSSPQAGFTVSDTTGCNPSLIHFYNQSQNGTSYVWHFGDGDTSHTYNTQHVYTNPGIFHAYLTVLNNNGCYDSSNMKTISIRETPVADFNINVHAGCAPLNIQMSDQSTHTNNPEYHWYVGSDSSTLQNPSFLLSNPGSYDVKFIVINASGCSDTLIMHDLIEVYDTTAPIQPALRYVTVLDNQTIKISWHHAPASDFKYYVLYRSDDQMTYTPIDTIYDQQTTTFIDSGVHTLDQSYCYKIQLFNQCDNTYPVASLLSHCSMDIQAEPSDDAIHIRWNKYAGCPVTSYKLYRSIDQFENEELIAVLDHSTNTYTDRDATCPLLYAYRIKATGLCNSTDFSMSDTSVAGPNSDNFIQTSKIKRTTIIDNMYVLTEWFPPENHPETVKNYYLYRSSGSEPYRLIAVLPKSHTSFIDSTVLVDTKSYHYKLEVENECGIISSESNQGTSILLRMHKDGYDSLLEWTKYQDWDTGVDYYIIEKKDGNLWKEIKRVDGNTLKTRVDY